MGEKWGPISGCWGASQRRVRGNQPPGEEGGVTSEPRLWERAHLFVGVFTPTGTSAPVVSVGLCWPLCPAPPYLQSRQPLGASCFWGVALPRATRAKEPPSASLSWPAPERKPRRGGLVSASGHPPASTSPGPSPHWPTMLLTALCPGRPPITRLLVSELSVGAAAPAPPRPSSLLSPVTPGSATCSVIPLRSSNPFSPGLIQQRVPPGAESPERGEIASVPCS